MPEVTMIKSGVHSIKGLRHVWKIENTCDVNVLRVESLLRIALLPFGEEKYNIYYEKDLSELNYSEKEIMNEVDYLAQFLKENEEFIFFWYEFTFRTGMLSLGMALISYQLNETEREKYERHLKKDYLPSIPADKIRNGEKL